MAGRIAYYGNIVKEGLVLNLDAAKKDSYPGFGTVWNDISGTTITGSLINGPTFSSNNNGIICDGVNDYIVYNPATLTTFSIEIAYTPLTFDTNTGTGRYNYILGSFETNIFVRYNGTNSGNNILLANHGGADIGIGGLAHQTGSTYIMTITFNDADKSTKVYFNSALNATATYNSTLRYQTSITLGTTFNSIIYACKIYNRALSATEVLQNYNATKGRFGL